jgi:hypothetical protein
MPFAQVLSRPQLIFCSKTWSFGIYFSWKILLKINIFHILNPNLTKQIPLNPVHQDLNFQQHQRHIPTPLKFSAMI